MKKNAVCIAVVVFVLFLSSLAWPQDCIFKPKNDESFSQALKSYHEVMAALVHGPADKGDLSQVRARADELVKLSKGILDAGLPDKLYKRCAEISAKAKELAQASDGLLARSRADSANEAMKGGLERVHNAYRDLNSALTTLQDLLDGFHDVLHPLWHEAYPKKDVAAIKAQIPKLKVRAKLILSTAETREKNRVAGAKGLLEAVTTLEEAAAANDSASILEALRVAHDAYEKLAEGQH